MTVDMSQFYEVFFDESEELLAEAERLLLSLDVDDPDAEDLNAIFRAAHSIKGGAATFGFTDMAEITHVLENLLDKIRKNEMALTTDHVDAFLSAKDVLEMELDGHRNAADVDEAQVEEVQAVLKAFSEAGGAEVKPASTVEAAPAAEVVEEKPAEPATTEAPAEVQQAANGMTIFNVALPEVTEKDFSNLQEELALLGDVTASQQDDGKHVIQLETDSSQDDIVSICSFIVDPDDLVVTTNATTEQADAAPEIESKVDEKSDADFGLFEDEPVQAEAKPTAEDGAKSTTEKVKVVEEVGYGLFSEDGKDDVEEGYGFFAPFKPHDDAKKAQLIGDDTPVSKEAAAIAEENKKTKEAAPKKAKPAAKERKAKGEKASAETASIRVGVEKVDQLINLVGELVITQAMIDQRVSALDPVDNEALINSVGQLTRNTKDLQESVMSIRMMPMDFVFSRFPRMVRDLANKLGKKIEFVTEGAATELDKGLIERIVDPLTHLVQMRPVS